MSLTFNEHLLRERCFCISHLLGGLSPPEMLDRSCSPPFTDAEIAVSFRPRGWQVGQAGIGTLLS